MKKFLVSAVLSASLFSYLNAASIDKNTLTINFEGYKTANMVATAGTVKNPKYTFGKDESSIKGLLNGATATFSPKNIDMGVELITNNIVNVFFKTLNNGKDVDVKITNVIEGDNQGSLTAKVSIGGQYETVGLHYTIKDGKFEAKGVLDLFAFKNSEQALKDLAKAAPGHAGISWSIVEITLSAKAK